MDQLLNLNFPYNLNWEIKTTKITALINEEYEY